MVSTACPIDSKDFSTRPSMLQSFSIAPHESQPRSFQRCTSGLSHGLQMDLQEAVQLEKQELEKMGLLPRPMEMEIALASMMQSDDEDNQVQGCCSSPPCWLYRQQRTAASLIGGHYGDCPPCSPPVPIPQHHNGLRGNLPSGVDVDQLELMSSSPCRVQLCDTFWNYSLSSFESQESLEAVTDYLDRKKRCAQASGAHPVDRTAGMARCKHSMPPLPVSSTADLVVNEDQGGEDLNDSQSPAEDEHVYHYGDVFEMEDL